MIREITRIVRVHYNVTVGARLTSISITLHSLNEPRGILTHNLSQQCVKCHDGCARSVTLAATSSTPVLSSFQRLLSFVLRKGSALARPCTTRWKVATLSTRSDSPLWYVTHWHTVVVSPIWAFIQHSLRGRGWTCGVL